MGYSKEQLLSRLQELQISFAQYDHPVALTVEELDKYVGHLKGAVTKNLFLKDKKQRLYIVSALTDTKVDLKVLSQRLGLGKGGLRMAPEEALGEILQVPLGCVTPFALLNETARHVSLLLDRGFKTQECCLFHPLSNDTSISLTTHHLDNFLKSIGREPAYVDLEANPSVGKDQPPDLAAFVPSEVQVLLDATQKTTSLQESQKASVAVNAVTPSNNSQKGKLKNAVSLSTSFADPDKFVDKILEKTSALLLSEIKEENVKQHGEQLGSVVSNSIRRQLSLELKNLANIFKNTAYTEGFQAGILCQQKRA